MWRSVGVKLFWAVTKGDWVRRGGGGEEWFVEKFSLRIVCQVFVIRKSVGFSSETLSFIRGAFLSLSQLLVELKVLKLFCALVSLLTTTVQY